MAAAAVAAQSAKARKNPSAALDFVQKEYMAIDDAEKKKCVSVVEEFVMDHVVKLMRAEDKVFDALYKRLYHTGSYYDGLRVGDAKEFDLNLLLDLDILKPNLEFTLWEGFVSIKRRPPSPSYTVPQQHRFAPILADLQKKLFDDNWYLDVDKVKKWTQGIVSKILPKVKFTREITEVRVRDSGPAKNLQITHRQMGQIDIDLVPAFVFSPAVLKGIKKELSQSKDPFFVIPKSPKNKKTNKNHFWRIDFHDQERNILKGAKKEYVKPLIKLLKLFRDANDPMNGISSYALKTVVMNMITEQPNKDWKPSLKAVLFLEGLEKLAAYLQEGKIPYVFDTRCNVLWDLAREQQVNTARYLENTVIKKLKASEDSPDCFEVWVSYFEKKPKYSGRRLE